MQYAIEKLAFERKEPIDGYMIKCWYLTEPKSEALVEITKDDVVVKRFFWPAYKIWNIPAHEAEIISGLKSGSDSGLRVAGSTGLGGNVYG